MDMILLSSIKQMQYLMTNAWIVMLDKVHCVFAYTVRKIIHNGQNQTVYHEENYILSSNDCAKAVILKN